MKKYFIYILILIISISVTLSACKADNAADENEVETKYLKDSNAGHLINVDTDIRLAVTRNMKEFFCKYPEKRNSPSIGGVYKLLEEKKDQFDPRAFLPPIMDTVMYGNIPDEDVAALVAVIE